MRFAYIDSQGNEVPIPSIDALALRIELGAVGPDTELYDAQADHWGPAQTHEIFHSLSRAADEEGFMAPPPPVLAGPEGAAEVSPEPAVVAQQLPVVEEPEAEAEQEEEPDDGEFDLGLTLAEPPPEEEEGHLGDAGSVDLRDSSDVPLIAETELALSELEPAGVEESAGEPESFTPMDELEAVVAEGESLELEASPEPAENGGGFDFGDLGTGLEPEDGPGPHEMGLETEMEFQAPTAGFSGEGEDLPLEQPMSSFEPDSPPGWMEEPDPGEVMDFSAVAAEGEALEERVSSVADAPVRQRRTPKDRPSDPKFKRQRSMSGPIVLVVLVLALGVGAYYGWPILQARLAESQAPERPPVVMPAIPEELVAQMRSLGETAIAAVVSEVSLATQGVDALAEPDEDWLGGVYLGNASQYAGIEAFWSSMEAFTQGLRAAEWQLYHDKYVEAVAEAGLGSDVAAQITERADSGLVAAQPQRDLAYAELERLAGAALDLHDFLLQNEADIVFRPGVTSASDPAVDPVLEIAAPDDVRDRMLSMFDEITEALDALGSLDRVTRDRLVEAMTARLQQVGMQ
jgi:hypothetical protein